MSRTIESTVYQFDELSDRAKERARDWFRQGIEVDDYAETVLEDASRIGALMGIDINTRPVQLMNGSRRYDPNVYFDLGRGSYASVDGAYRYQAGSVKAIKAEAPKDTVLHTIVLDLQAVQRRNFYGLTAHLSHGRETTRIEVDSERQVSETDRDTLEQALRDFTGWIYAQLQREYEYRTENDTVDEDIRANEYEFTEDGDRA